MVSKNLRGLSPNQQLEQIQAKVTSANLHLTHLENEVQVVQQRRQALSDEIQAETARLVQERKAHLAELEDASASRGRELDKRRETALSEVVAAERKLLDVQGQVVSADTELKALGDRAEAVRVMTRQAQTELETAQRKLEQVDARIQFLESGVVPLQEQQSQLKTEIAELEHTRDDLVAANSTQNNQYMAEKNRIEAELSDLLQKQQQLEIAQARMFQQHKQMSESIAMREKASDEREEVLKRREFKVAQDEKMVARNANLLNL